MAQQATNRVHEVGLSWKLSSLEVLSGGNAGDCVLNIDITIPQVGEYRLKQQQKLLVLGVCPDAYGSTDASLSHCLTHGTACFWSLARELQGRATLREKVDAWRASPVATTLHGCSSWAVSKHVVARIRRWELMSLRKVFRLRRRPGEGFMTYNVRTARWLDKMHVDFLLPHAHHQLLRKILQAAWRESTFQDNTGENLLAVARNYKSLLWWTGIKDLPYKTRLAQGAAHNRQGPTVTYENVFVDLMGETWRETRNACNNFLEWRHHCDRLVDQLCAKWRIPLLPQRQAVGHIPCFQDSRRSDYEALAGSPFSEKRHQDDDRWEPGRRCFLFIMDSQVVSRILNGKMHLATGEHMPLFTRIGKRMAFLLGGGWQPPRLYDNPFEWRPRCYNTRADALCSIVLDTCAEIKYTSDDLHDVLQLQPNFLVYTDGACRGDGVSAFAWVIYLVVFDGKEYSHVTVALQGRLVQENLSSFITEALAVDGASEMLRDIISCLR